MQTLPENTSSPATITRAEALRRALAQEIADGTLPPGARLDEQEIAQRFGVSRTPAREAFRLLAAGGLVELRGRQGVIVRSIDVATLIEMFQVMAELEGLCARLAARRINPASRAAIEEAHRRLVESAGTAEPDAFYEINEAFHEAIYEASRNAFLAQQTRSLRNRVSPYRRRVTYVPGRIGTTIDEHAQVMEAIFAHDGERAHNAMRDHVNLLGDDLVDFIAVFE